MTATIAPGGDLDIATAAALFADPTRARVLMALSDRLSSQLPEHPYTFGPHATQVLARLGVPPTGSPRTTHRAVRCCASALTGQSNDTISPDASAPTSWPRSSRPDGSPAAKDNEPSGSPTQAAVDCTPVSDSTCPTHSRRWLSLPAAATLGGRT
ncbi:MAG: hypothetical protein ACYCST_21715 [Acidimicrobiales bacterium]